MSDNHEAAAQARSEHVAALKAEREGYERRGLSDRVKQVDGQIAAIEKAPAGRTSPAKKTAAAKKAAAADTAADDD